MLDFWFDADHRKRWFRSTEAFDQAVRTRFGSTWEQARDGELDTWQATAAGCLALVIVLDQLPLNMFRGSALAYSTEARSREVSARAIAQGFDQALTDVEKNFLYMPYMHSESLADQDQSIALFERAGLVETLRWARHHREIVRRFGRFPHRNGVLGRTSSAEEQAWLDSDEAFSG